MSESPPDSSAPSPRPRNRTNLWLAIGAGLGLVIAIVALVIAIDANTTTDSDVKVTNEVRQEARRAIGAVSESLRDNVAAADDILGRLRTAAAGARRTRVALRREANANRAGVASNAEQIQRLQAEVDELQRTQGEVDTLSAQVQRLMTSVADLSADQRLTDRRLGALEDSATAANDDGAP